VAVTVGLALGGLGMMITSLEERVGPVDYRGPGGRAGAFPVLSACFIVFGGAGVGLPGTAGFVADDLLLHTLWSQSPGSTVAVIVASALLAVATLIAYSRSFLGRTTRHAGAGPGGATERLPSRCCCSRCSSCWASSRVCCSRRPMRS
jgi:NADH-quinone oxidoreductase subunit M